MKKLKLQIEALCVESFSTYAVEPHQGTVLAHSGNSCNTYNHETCAQFNTCGGYGSCNGEYTCNRNCWPQEKTWYIEAGADPTPCCTLGCP